MDVSEPLSLGEISTDTLLVGFPMFYYPILSMVNEWWIVRRGLAWGIIASASGASGVVMPFIVEALLNQYGYKTTLRAIAVALVVLTGPMIPFFKGRLPPAERSALAKTDWSFWKKPIFWVYSVSNLAQGLGFFFPSLYLPSYATSVGLSSTQGALLLALMNVAQMLGQFTFGILSDKLPVNLLILISTIVPAVASLALWGLAHSLAPLIMFSLIYGFFGYGYVSLRVHMGTAITTDPTAALATFSIFCFGQGVGNILAGPISAGLLTQVVKPRDYGALRYRSVVIFTGCAMVVSALSVGSWYVRPKRVRG
jgi:predicted MFS family arabinose efflux permease